MRRPLNHWLIAGILAAVALGGWALLFFLPPGQAGTGFYPTCWLHETTGLYCGGCGATRCLAALAHGHILQALAYNALFVAFFIPLYGLALAHHLYFAITSKPLVRWARIPIWIYPILVVVLMLFVVARNLPYGWSRALAPHELGAVDHPSD